MEQAFTTRRSYIDTYKWYETYLKAFLGSVIQGSFGFTLIFKGLDNILILPADLIWQTSKSTELK